MNLSEHFTLSEMTFSETAARKSLSNNPTEEVVKNLTALCVNVLEPLRARLNRPIRITSGYRSEAVNKAIGGSKNSQHIQGKAADLQVPGMTSKEVFETVKGMGINLDQCIEEFGEWIHVSYNGELNRNQFLIAVKKGKRTVYLPG